MIVLTASLKRSLDTVRDSSTYYEIGKGSLFPWFYEIQDESVFSRHLNYL